MNTLVVVSGALDYPCMGGDVLHRRGVKSLLPEQLECALEDMAPRLPAFVRSWFFFDHVQIMSVTS